MFFVGQVYNRRKDIHEKYRGQSQGGISTPKGFPLIFIFTGETGKKYGYHDTFRDDGVFLLTGEGMKGDMSMVRGNLAIATHNKKGKTLQLFQILKRGMVQYMGQAQCLNHHYEKRPDVENKIRDAIIFELEMLPENKNIVIGVQKTQEDHEASSDISKFDRATLLKIIENSVTSRTEYSQAIKRVYERSEAVKYYVLKRANGICELCKNPAPFRTKEKRRYLEPHHITRISDGGPDHPRRVAAICPNCHKEVHYGEHGEEKNKYLAEYILQIEV